ncbi:MAG: FAD-dependent oxidoreductase [Planctomycetaceae bacterium]
MTRTPTATAIATESIWSATQEIPQQPMLSSGTTADVCVVGAGISGLSTAYHLTKAGKSVVVIEAAEIGARQTALTTAHLSNAIDDRFVEMERLHGQAKAKLAGQSHAAAIDSIEQILRVERIECDFERLDGYLIAGDENGQDLLSQEYEAALRSGVDVSQLSSAPWADFDTGRCLRFANQAQFHPLKYLVGLKDAIIRGGGRIYGSTRAKEIAGGTDAYVRTEHGATVRAGAIFVATNTPINDMIAMHTKQAPYVTYVIGTRVPRGSVPFGLYWDTLDPYHYVRLQRGSVGDDNDTLIIGGEDHKCGQASDGPERFQRLEQWARRRFPMMEGTEFRWSGQVMETMDGLGFIGRNPMDQNNVYIATGDSGMGMTHGAIAGILISDLILGRENRWESLYEPSRKTPGAIGDFTKENLNVAKEYGSWLTGGDVGSEEEIPCNCGAVIRQGTTKLAVYRDEQGRLTRLSAVCPHLKCIVSWNGVLRTWDCPCHGSRFDAHGQVLDGPAYGGLAPYDDEQ